MKIKVSTKEISNHDVQKILDFYNSKKSQTEEPLEILNRCESGFQIKISYMKNQYCDINNKIKQLRWEKGYLSSQKYIDFTIQEKTLLYNALISVLGNNKVKMI